MENKENLLQAAMLAKMVGVHLEGVDKFTVESSGKRANNINIEQFVAPLVGRQAPTGSVQTDGATAAMIQAAKDAERIAFEMVPDTSVGATLAPVPAPAPVAQTFVQNNIPSPQASPAPQSAVPTASSQDIEDIKLYLDKINSNLNKMTGMLGKFLSTVATKSPVSPDIDNIVRITETPTKRKKNSER